jgi:hypothetical protein
LSNRIKISFSIGYNKKPRTRNRLPRPRTKKIIYRSKRKDNKTTGIENLRKLGFDPISFRAGRFHFNTEILRILEKNNVRYDSSVVPGLQERCNHIGAPYCPYFPSYENHCKEGRFENLRITHK